MKFGLFLLGLIVIVTCSQYNEEESIQFAAYSLSSYCRMENLNPFDCGKICERSGELTNVQFMQDNDVNLFGFIGYQPQKDYILVVFRGSILSDLKNIQIDLDIDKIDYEFCDGCQVANGFYSAYLKLKSQSNQLFEQYIAQYPKSKVITTGHSLGAALASYFAIDIFQTYNYQIDQLYTFGSPRLGNQEFVDYYNQVVNPSTHFRVVKGKDNIVRFPFQELGYRHVGQEIFYDEKDNYTICKDEFDPLCDKYYFWDWSFEDHQKYVKCSFSEFRGDRKCSGRKNSQKSLFLSQQSVERSSQLKN